jgi:hypothetical protein
MQLPALLNTVQSSALAFPSQMFLDSVELVMGAEYEFNSSPPTPDYTIPPPLPPPSIVIPDYLSLAIKMELLITWGCASP